jgi:hypothetical protein
LVQWTGSAAWGTVISNSSFFHVEVPGWRTPDRRVSQLAGTVFNSLLGIETIVQPSTITFFTILITLNQGKVIAVEYDPDSTCSSDCATDLCVDNMCGVNSGQCVGGTVVNATTAGVYDCDMKVSCCVL